MYIRGYVALLIFGFTQTSLAGSISGKGHLIQDDQVHPVLMEEVLDTCGEPKRREGNVLVHDQAGGVENALHFNDAGELESVDELERQ